MSIAPATNEDKARFFRMTGRWPTEGELEKHDPYVDQPDRADPEGKDLLA